MYCMHIAIIIVWIIKNQKRIRLLKYEEVLEREEHNFKILRKENSVLFFFFFSGRM